MNMSHSERRRNSSVSNHEKFSVGEGGGVEARPQTVFKEKLGEWNLVCQS
jgi:hypothetical protein